MKFENVKEVKIKAVAGKVEIEGWDKEYVELEYRLHGDDVRVETDLKNGTLTVVEKPRRKFFNHLGKDSWAEIWLKIPRNAVVDLNNVTGTVRGKDVRFKEVVTVNGGITLESCETESLKSVNGGITAHLSIAGPLKASTVNGSLTVTIDELEDDVELSCVNGGITLRLTDFCDARILAKRVNGDVRFINIDPENPVIGTGDYEVRVSTVNGDVRVELL